MFEIYQEIEPDLIIESSNRDKLTIEKLNKDKSELQSMHADAIVTMGDRVLKLEKETKQIIII